MHKDEKVFEHVKEEMADVLFALVRLSDLLNIDLNEAFWEKTKKNELNRGRDAIP